jgi:hypothetical protein
MIDIEAACAGGGHGGRIGRFARWLIAQAKRCNYYDLSICVSGAVNPIVGLTTRRINRRPVKPFDLASAAMAHPLALRVVREGLMACRNAAVLGRYHPHGLSISAMCAAHSLG